MSEKYIVGHVNGQAFRVGQPLIVTDTINYLSAKFDFSEEWEGLNKWVHFSNGDESYICELDYENEIKKDTGLNLTTGIWKVFIHGERYVDGEVDVRITTEQSEICVRKTGKLEGGTVFPDIEVSVVEQILAKIGNTEILTTEQKSDIVHAINEVNESVHDVEGGVLEHDVLISQIVENIGDLDELTTENASSVIVAINEVAELARHPQQLNADYAENDSSKKDFIANRPFYVETVHTDGGDVEVVHKIDKKFIPAMNYIEIVDTPDIDEMIEDKTGILGNLYTKEKDTLVGAINEVRSSIVNHDEEFAEKYIGDLEALVTENKRNVVSAINEIAGEKYSADWDLNDPEKNGYIKNRPFGIDENGIVQKIDHKYIDGVYEVINSDGRMSQDSLTSLPENLYYIEVPIPVLVYNEASGNTDRFYIDGWYFSRRIDDETGVWKSEAIDPYTNTSFVYYGDGSGNILWDRVFDDYMSKNDPAANGALSINRMSGTTVGLRSVAVGNNTTASGAFSFASGDRTAAYGVGSSASGKQSTAAGTYAHAEGNVAVASGDYSHAEGDSSSANGTASHAEGSSTTNGYYSHGEGYSTVTDARAAHAEGNATTARGDSSHAEGESTNAAGRASHAEGIGTYASGTAVHVQGEYNVSDPGGDMIHIVGNGTGITSRSNAHTLRRDGDAWFAGDVYVGSNGGKDKDEGSKKLATEEYVLQHASGENADYEESDATSPSYIKNRPFYEDTIYIEYDKSFLKADTNWTSWSSETTFSFGEDIPFDTSDAFRVVYATKKPMDIGWTSRTFSDLVPKILTEAEAGSYAGRFGITSGSDVNKFIILDDGTFHSFAMDIMTTNDRDFRFRIIATEPKEVVRLKKIDKKFLPVDISEKINIELAVASGVYSVSSPTIADIKHAAEIGTAMNLKDPASDYMYPMIRHTEKDSGNEYIFGAMYPNSSMSALVVKMYTIAESGTVTVVDREVTFGGGSITGGLDAMTFGG